MKFLLNCLIFQKYWLTEQVKSDRQRYEMTLAQNDDKKDNILFFAGNGASSCGFANTYHLLSKTYNLHAVDMPLEGDDFSAQGDINVKYQKVLDIAEQSNKRIIFVAHSMGGGIALKVAAKLKAEKPEIFQRIRVLHYKSFSSLSKAISYMNIFFFVHFLFAALVAVLFMYFTSFGFLYPFLIASAAFFILDYLFDYVEYLVIKPLLIYSDSNLDVVNIARDMLNSNQLRVVASEDDPVIKLKCSLANELGDHTAVEVLNSGWHYLPLEDDVRAGMNSFN
jgi:pimeloyl-ACP methyl ester carboxylesterase